MHFLIRKCCLCLEKSCIRFIAIATCRLTEHPRKTRAKLVFVISGFCTAAARGLRGSELLDKCLRAKKQQLQSLGWWQGEDQKYAEVRRNKKAVTCTSWGDKGDSVEQWRD